MDLEEVALQLSGRARIGGGNGDGVDGEEATEGDDGVGEAPPGVSVVAIRPSGNMILFSLTKYLEALSRGDIYRG